MPRPCSIGSSGSRQSRRFHCICGILGPSRNPLDGPGDDVETSGCGVLLRPGEQHLHADADTEEGPPRVDRIVRGRFETGAAQRIHAGTERADTGQDDSGGVGDQTRVPGEAGVGAALLQRLLCRVEVSDPVVEDGDQRGSARHRTPLVDGTPAASSTRTASRSDRASPLKVASMM